MGPQLYGPLVFYQGGKTIHWKKDSLSIYGAGEIEQPRAEE